MKRWNAAVLVGSALALGVLSGCASPRVVQTPAELDDARAAYKQAASGPAAEQNRAGLIEARQSLEAAEGVYRDRPDSADVKTKSYLAQRKAEVADAEARTNAAAQTEAENQRQIAARSERRANLALERLGLAAREDANGTVITLPTTMMFRTNEAEILPQAKGRLTNIAKAMSEVLAEGAPQDAGRKVVLIGYTDDVGDEEHNCDLSKRRAAAVNEFLSQHGLAGASVESKGRGEAAPVADNTTPEGRAQNRRVEIVITRAEATPSPDTGGAPGDTCTT